MSFIIGVLTTLIALFFAAMMYAIGMQDGRQEVALELKGCLAVASVSDACDNSVLDKYLPKKGN